MTEEYDRYRRAQASRWLEHVRRLGDRCKALQAEIEAQRDIASGLCGIDYAKTKVSGSGVHDTVAETISRLQEMIAAYCAELAGYITEQQEAHRALSQMEDSVGADALRRHYLAGQSWELVCVEMGYTWDGIMALRRRAVLEVYEVMPVKYRDPHHPAV